jgi:hypothetical protein
MNANAELLPASGTVDKSARESTLPPVHAACASQEWNPKDFAQEQIRGLVRQVFFADAGRPVKQVVFSAIEPNLNIAGICDGVAAALAQETRGRVALIEAGQEAAATPYAGFPQRGISLKKSAAQIAGNLFRMPRHELECSEEGGAGLHWLPRLEQLRKEFEYVLIEGPTAGISSEAVLLGQLTDGIILVLDARRTRRATARTIKETLQRAQCRILGTVLTDRTFPIPERIYRRL